MQMSGADMRFHLKRLSATIEPSHLTKQQTINPTRTMAEICRMDADDMSAGFKKTSKTRKQATRNHARLIASIILTILHKDKSESIETDELKISWDKEKQKRLWKYHGVKYNTQNITRLDTFIHRLLVDDARSIDHWVSTAESWEIYNHDNGDDKHSNLEYDPSDLIMTHMDDTQTKTKQLVPHEKEKKKTLSAFFAKIPCFSQGENHKQKTPYKQF